MGLLVHGRKVVVVAVVVLAFTRTMIGTAYAIPAMGPEGCAS